MKLKDGTVLPYREMIEYMGHAVCIRAQRLFRVLGGASSDRRNFNTRTLADGQVVVVLWTGEHQNSDGMVFHVHPDDDGRLPDNEMARLALLLG